MTNSSPDSASAPPFFSVLIPAHDSRKWILRCLRSLKEQTCGDFEAVVVDDGSSDGTGELVEEFIRDSGDGRFSLVRSPGQGASAARNAGASNTQGRWLSFLDADDEFLPQKLERVRESIRRDPSLTMVAHTMWKVCPGQERRLWDNQRKYDPAKPLFPQLYVK